MYRTLRKYGRLLSLRDITRDATVFIETRDQGKLSIHVDSKI